MEITKKLLSRRRRAFVFMALPAFIAWWVLGLVLYVAFIPEENGPYRPTLIQKH